VLDLIVTGSAGQNPDPSGTSAPVAVHLYELASTQKFERADIFALVEHEQATLGNDLLASSDFVLLPSGKREIRQDLKPGTGALGVVVLFQKIDQAQWRATAPVAATGLTRLVMSVGSLSLSLKPNGP
jgi:type VI secretion system VasD/TssJ family lipoprotein